MLYFNLMGTYVFKLINFHVLGMKFYLICILLTTNVTDD